MELQLKNVGMIKEANVKIDGLTVIAGENDTGKSTVGKALFILLKARTFIKNIPNNSDFYKKIFWLEKGVFNQKVLKNNYLIELKLNNDIIKVTNNEYDVGKKNFIDTLFIESPVIFNFYQTFKAISNANSILDFKIPYSYLSWDIYLKLAQKSKNRYLDNKTEKNILNFLKSIINGDFIFKNEMSSERWVFKKEKEEFELENVATGIKQFGLLLALLKNGYLSKERIVIFDEPEVHLHPKWQLEMAKVIVELVKNGVKVLVTSHSPYMIEALEIYSKKEKINSNFYLSKKDKNIAFIKDVTDDISSIYDLLAEPFDTLEDDEIGSIKW